MNRKKRLALNTIASLGLQITTVFCGLILPRLFLQAYGSEVNGLVGSITQFLSLITLMELGIGSVIQSALYKPLADNNNDQINCIITSGIKFYRKVCFVLVIYVVLLMVVFPLTASKNFEWQYTIILIFSISMSSFARYIFGIMDQTFLNASQLGYVHLFVRILALIINAILTYILIKLDFSIQFVKLSSSIVFLIQPLFVRLYINKRYTINRRMNYDSEPITQKWNGMAQHFSYVILENTDIVVLTFFSTLSNISIYNVYNSVVYGIKQLVFSFTRGAQHLIGDMIAKNEKGSLYMFFGALEYVIHMITVFLFSCVGILIIPFMKVYTVNITDADYIQPLFALLITMANAVHTIRTPYNMVIMAAGHYKQTQNYYIIASILNLSISIIMVRYYGLIGVAIGTFVAMVYQTLCMIKYVSKNIINWPIRAFVKQMIGDILSISIIVLITHNLSLSIISFSSWIVLAIKVVIISAFVIAVVSLGLFRKELYYILNTLKFKKIKD